MTLSQLKRGDSAVITRVDAPDNTVAKLAARGIVAGTNINILVSGNPCLISTHNDKWALSHLEASGIHVSHKPSLTSKIKSTLSWA